MLEPGSNVSGLMCRLRRFVALPPYKLSEPQAAYLISPEC